jgi:hypothetical protein
MWRWLWRVGPHLVNAFQHLAEQYRGLQRDRQAASTPIIRPNIEMVELPRVATPRAVKSPIRGARPARRPPPVPTGQQLPPLPSCSAGPNTTSSVWDDSELGE